MNDDLIIGDLRLKSRLIVGTGKYPNMQITANAVHASGAEIVTVAVRRVNIEDRSKERLQSYINPKEIMYLPNTAGCFTQNEAVRTLLLARECLNQDDIHVKLEVLGDKKTLYPNMPETLCAIKELKKNGITKIWVYCNDDPIMVHKALELGVAAIMPLAAPIGSGLGMQNPYNISILIRMAREYNTPIIVDAGIGKPSHASQVMEMGCDGVLMNTAIAYSSNPIKMAEAMKLAIISGRVGYLAGFMKTERTADPSSPTDGMIE